MSDLSDPTALPNPRATAGNDYRNLERFERRPYMERMNHEQHFLNGWDAAAAHFAAELDGLRAQIESVRSIHKQITIADGPDNAFPACDSCEQEWPCTTMALLAQSPRGTVARIQADARTWIEEAAGALDAATTIGLRHEAMLAYGNHDRLLRQVDAILGEVAPGFAREYHSLVRHGVQP